ncbi:MAG: hypothetical protein IIC73_08705 [Armatimonadetes bacterium]|nr:hypothetical protein [Armatimonadota bacterium]
MGSALRAVGLSADPSPILEAVLATDLTKKSASATIVDATISVAGKGTRMIAHAGRASASS